MKKFRSFGGTEETRISSQRTDKTRRLFLFRPIQAGPDFFFGKILDVRQKKIRQPRLCREQQRERERGVPPPPPSPTPPRSLAPPPPPPWLSCSCCSVAFQFKTIAMILTFTSNIYSGCLLRDSFSLLSTNLRCLLIRAIESTRDDQDGWDATENKSAFEIFFALSCIRSKKVSEIFFPQNFVLNFLPWGQLWPNFWASSN